MTFRLVTGMGLLALMLGSSTALAATLEGPLQIMVSRDRQELKVYDGATVVAHSRVSTGKAGHATPTGIFSILEKKRKHFSNIYNNAPMPFMQRLTWSGIALHASSSVPAHPASHGCVRMPDDFAKTLFNLTQRGGHVLVTDRETAPQRITHAKLFEHAALAPEQELLSDASLRPAFPDEGQESVEVAMSNHVPDKPEPAVRPERQAPVRILITRTGERESLRELQTLLSTLGYETGVADGLNGRRTSAAIRAFQEAENRKADGMITPDLIAAVYARAGKGMPPHGRLLVRRKFEPVLDVPLTIDAPQIALGTHFLLARNVDTVKGSADWYGVTLRNDLSPATMKRLGIETPADAEAGDALAAVLDRLDIPADIRIRVSALLSEGASLSISDTGLGQETGAGTDFITVTREIAGKAATPPAGKKRRKASSIVAVN